MFFMGHKRSVSFRYKIAFKTNISSGIITACGICGCPIHENEAYVSQKHGSYTLDICHICYSQIKKSIDNSGGNDEHRMD